MTAPRDRANRLRSLALAMMAEADALDPPECTETELRAMMADPLYWRDHDPEMVRRVAAGFRAIVAAGMATADTGGK